jgi:hypothetical protein
MKAKRTNTNAIKGNKMASMQERKTYKAWGDPIHVRISAKKKSRAHTEDGIKVFKKYCVGERCSKIEIVANRNTVLNKGDECQVCFSEFFDKFRLSNNKSDFNASYESSISTKVAF